MALVIADRVRETTTTTGTGTVTLAGPYTSFQAFSAGVGDGNSTYYTIASAATGEWEVGIGTYTSSGNTLSRTTVLASSNSGSLVNFSAGSKDVFVTQPAERSLLVQSAGSGLFSGVAAFTANGIPYANSTSTLTTGSALTFDGTALAPDGVSRTLGTTALRWGTVYATAFADGTDQLVGSSGTTVRWGFGSSWGSQAFAISGSEQMRLTSTGLGIGTSSPGAKLDVVTGANNRLRVSETSSTLYFDSLNAAASAWGPQYSRATTFSWLTAASGTPSIALTLDSSGNLGLGVTPSAWAGASVNYNTFQFGVSSVTNVANTAAEFAYNQYIDSVGTRRYINTNTALRYRMGNTDHAWFTAPSGTAGNAISFTQAMTLDASGNLGIGTTSGDARASVWTTDNTVYSSSSAGNLLQLRNSSTTSGVYAGINFVAAGNGANVGTANINAVHTGDGSAALTFSTRNSATTAERARIDSSGNLGLGATPSAWASTWKGIQLKGTPNFVAGGTDLNVLANAYYDGTNYRYIDSYARASRYYQYNGTHQWFVTTSTEGAGNTISFTQAMTLDASGNLALGTTSFGAFSGTALGIYGSTTARFKLMNSTSGTASADGAELSYTGTELAIENRESGTIVFYNGGTERARIDSSGNLLVGTTVNPVGAGARVTAVNTGAYYAGSFVNDNKDYQTILVWNKDTTGTRYLMEFGTNATYAAKGSITTDGTNTAFNTTSDYRLKDNQQPLTGSGVFIDALQPKTWNWKQDGSKGVGFIAHEVQAVSPGSVVGEKDAVDEEGNPKYQAMEYGSAEFIANIIAELQSLRKRVAQLEGK